MTNTQRNRKTIEFYPKPEWTKPDAQLAEKTGKSRAIISFMRHRLGYPPFKRIAMLSAQLAKSRAPTGGLATSKDNEHPPALGRSGGRAVSADRKHMSRIGRKKGKN